MRTAQTNSRDVRPLRVLVVDDDQGIRTLVRAWLSRQPGVSVVAEAGDGRAAVDIALLTRPDVVVMDLHMPESNGIEATRQILISLPRTRVIAMSGEAEAEARGAIVEAGAECLLPKGTGPRPLLDAILRPASSRLAPPPALR